MRRLLLFFFSHRTLALLRWDIHFMLVRLKNAITFRNAAINKKAKSHTGPLYLNLGSGPRGLKSNNWLNIDGFKDTNVHHLCDFNKTLPFSPALFDGVFCEHVMEHFSYDDGRRIMAECNRILKKSGVLRIVVPNGRTFLSAYLNDPQSIVKYKSVPTGLPMEAVNTWFYQRYEHQCIYDAEYLIDSLLKAGFTSARETSFGESVFNRSEVVLDDPKYSWESLYVEAVK